MPRAVGRSGQLEYLLRHGMATVATPTWVERLWTSLWLTSSGQSSSTTTTTTIITRLGPRSSTANIPNEDSSKRSTEQTVDGEVTRRVDDDQQIAEFRVIEMEMAALPVARLEDGPEYLIQQRRRLTHDENEDNHDDTECDVIIFVVVLSMKRTMISPAAAASAENDDGRRG